MTTRYKALAGAGLALALVLTGCNGTSEGAESTTADGTTTASASQPQAGSSAPASASPAPSSSASSSPAVASSAGPSFEPVTSERPKSDQTAQIKGYEALQQFYDIKRAQFEAGSVSKEQLGVAVRDPYLSTLADRMAPIETADQSYSGTSKIELIEPIIGGTSNAQGEQFPHTNAQLLVCEDNTGVVVKDKDGKRVSSGSVLRYQITYIVTWRQDDQAWKVVTDQVVRDENGDPKSC